MVPNGLFDELVGRIASIPTVKDGFLLADSTPCLNLSVKKYFGEVTNKGTYQWTPKTLLSEVHESVKFTSLSPIGDIFIVGKSKKENGKLFVSLEVRKSEQIIGEVKLDSIHSDFCLDGTLFALNTKILIIIE